MGEYVIDDSFEDSSESFICPKCGDKSRRINVPLLINVRNQRVDGVESFVDDTRYSFYGAAITPTRNSWDAWVAAVCLGCRTSSVWRHGQLIYPRPEASIAPHPDMDAAARELFIEATGVQPISARAAAALARAAMESQIKALLPESRARDLQQRVGELQPLVRPMLWELLTTLRVVGNDALHGTDPDAVALDLTGADADMLNPLLGAINMLVDEVVTQPREARKLYEQIPQTKRDAAEKAAEKYASSKENKS